MTSVPPPFEHPGPPPARPELPEGVDRPAPPPAVSGDGLPRLGVPVWAPFAAMLAAFCLVIVASIVLAAFVRLAGGDTRSLDHSDPFTIALTVLQDAALIGAAWLAVRVFGGPASPASFGLVPVAWRRALKVGLAVYLGYWLFTLVLLAIVGQPPEQDLTKDLKNEDALGVLAGYGILVCVIAPMAEELFFRGFLFRVLAERAGLARGAAVTGVLFGLIHLPGSPLEGAVVLAVLGTGLCIVLWRTGSLIPCMLIHAFNNSLSYGLTKELPWWGVILLVLAGMGAVLGASLLVIRPRRTAPSPA